MQVLARALKVRLRAEVRHVDNERIPFPMTMGVTVPLADIGRQVRTSVHDDVALPPLPLTYVVEDRDGARRLHDPAKAAGWAAKFRQPAGEAAVRQLAVLRTVMAIHARRVVARSKFRHSRRRGRIVFAATAGHRLAPARLGRLQQRKTEFPVGAGRLLGLRPPRPPPPLRPLPHPPPSPPP